MFSILSYDIRCTNISCEWLFQQKVRRKKKKLCRGEILGFLLSTRIWLFTYLVIKVRRSAQVPCFASETCDYLLVCFSNHSLVISNVICWVSCASEAAWLVMLGC
jgi:hypothetical protein